LWQSGQGIESGLLFSSSVYVRFDQERYITVREKSQLEHNHEIRQPSVINGVRFVNREAELTAEECSYITNILTSMRGASLRRCLEAHFPKREFSSSLVQRMVKKGRTALFWNDSDAINLFMDYGASLCSSSGVSQASSTSR
jgi:hypothetical protein